MTAKSTRRMARLGRAAILSLLIGAAAHPCWAQEDAKGADLDVSKSGPAHIPNHQPDKVNPVWRSWQFTTPGDIVEYRLTKNEAFDRERRVYQGEKNGAKIVKIYRFLGDKAIDPILAAEKPQNVPPNDAFILFYEQEGYTASFEARTNGGVPFPCLKLDNAIVGRYVYAEDVPMGGLVYSENYTTGATIELAGFRRAAEPSPSQLPIWVRFPGDEPEESNIQVESVEGPKEKKGVKPAKAAKGAKGKKGEPEPEEPANPNVRELGLIMREDAESTPAYFRPDGTKTDELAQRGYLTTSLHISPKLAVYYQVLGVNEAEPSRNFSYMKKSVVARHDGEFYSVVSVTEGEGSLPEGIVAGETTVSRIEAKSFALADSPAYALGQETRGFGPAGDMDANHYLVLEGPFANREKRPEGGETQEVTRRRHNFHLSRDLDPVVLRWQVYERWYTQDANEKGDLLDSRFEESYVVTTIQLKRPLSEQEAQEAAEAVAAHLATQSTPVE